MITWFNQEVESSAKVKVGRIEQKERLISDNILYLKNVAFLSICLRDVVKLS